MSDESLMTAAHAAGFAFASDDLAEFAPRKARSQATPREVLSPILTREPVSPSAHPTVLQRAFAATTLPVWAGGSRA
jgi:hypothetical protein